MKKRVFFGTDANVGAFLAAFGRDVVASFAADEIGREKIEYALSEILNNSVEHGHRGDPRKMVTVRWSLTNGSLVVIVADEGGGFLPVIPVEPPPASVPRGRGLWSISADGTKLGFNVKGNEVTLVFEGRKEHES
ncbi:MAG: ATP-binding protein [Nitrospinae bacterium]|nr:ATP-binding protein [Nitrospinota bacterium]